MKAGDGRGPVLVFAIFFSVASWSLYVCSIWIFSVVLVSKLVFQCVLLQTGVKKITKQFGACTSVPYIVTHRTWRLSEASLVNSRPPSPEHRDNERFLSAGQIRKRPCIVEYLAQVISNPDRYLTISNVLEHSGSGSAGYNLSVTEAKDRGSTLGIAIYICHFRKHGKSAACVHCMSSHEYETRPWAGDITSFHRQTFLLLHQSYDQPSSTLNNLQRTRWLSVCDTALLLYANT